MPRSKTYVLKALDATVGAALCRLYSTGSPRFRDPTTQDPTYAAALSTPLRILVLRPGGMGDMLLLLPLLKRLKSKGILGMI